ncbi:MULTISPECIES: DUF6880 family protein [unclassified Cyanobium]|uniref:DUF6880 family protein n=1 Tax=unclassified Cyanobium TaxID=2627006 RepID=UPI0020CF14EE|nr:MULTISPECIES: DUF6880 family protein [unclassified Cyanobium]MCP9834897.1 hypothetical protein [Cyanobium sp. La Preciosa 7G6]MCP9937660.1 hypothetical protein [Cyanobium sp. Aljojuca 7A6]
MASKRSLNARNLEALGAAALAELLIEVSSGQAVIQRRLRLALAAAEGASGAAQEVRKRLAAIDRARTFVSSARRPALLRDLEAQRQAITGPIAAEDPRGACELLLRFLEISAGVLARCSDSTGAVSGVFERAAEQLGPLALDAQLAPETLAEHAAELLLDNDHGPFDGLVPALAEALGDAGLQRLERCCREGGARGGSRLLIQIAVARGDVEGYLGQFSAADLRRRPIAAAVAQVLLANGRAVQALEILDGASADNPGRLDGAWLDSRLAVLEALERPAEAQELRWQWFSRSLSIPHLRDYLRRLEAFEDGEAEERAFGVAEQHPSRLLALEFLVGWGALARAARLVLAHTTEWDGEAVAIHSAAAERLSADHPLAATLLLRAMVWGALELGRSQRYRYAAEHLRSCDLLADRLDDWQGHPDHAAFVARLRERFGGRWGFWRLVEA